MGTLNQPCKKKLQPLFEATVKRFCLKTPILATFFTHGLI